MTLHFPNWDALHFALAEGFLSAELARQSGRVSVDAHTGILFAPHANVELPVVELLKPLGISVNGAIATENSFTVEHLWQAIPLKRITAHVTERTPVLFEIHDHESLTKFIQELLRLGCDRISVRTWQAKHLVLVNGPPYYALLPALESRDGVKLRAYVEQAPRFWVAVGWSYPLADQIHVGENQLALIAPARDWTTLSAESWTDVTDCLAIAEPRETSITAQALVEPWTVPIRLTSASTTEPASLWVIRAAPHQRLEGLLQQLGPEVREQLSFVVTEQLAVIRLRPSRAVRPSVDVPGSAYRAYLRIPNLFVPIGQRLQPPLHRETIRQLLARDLNLVHVVSESATQAVQVETIAEASFRPLSHYVEEVLNRDRDALHEWAWATRFAFTELTNDEPSIETSAAINKPSPAPLPKTPQEVRNPEPAVAARTRARTRLTTPKSAPPMARTDAERRQMLTQTEEEFLNAGGALNCPPRRVLWPRLARLNADLGQPAEAALAWMHALWDSENLAPEQLWGWVAAEKALPTPELTAQDLSQMLSRNTPTPGDIRALASVVAWSGNATPIPPVMRQALPQIQGYLQNHEHLLPIRAVWLAWLSWARAAGGDALTLARVRDRLLNRLLERGLNPDVDLPSFLRFAGRADGDRLRAIRGWLEETRTAVMAWYARQTKSNSASDPTAAYINLLFAMGFARLGEPASARTLMKQAETVLANIVGDTADAHDFLLQALVWRIEEVLAGRSASGPLPPEMLDYLAQLHVERNQLPRANDYEVRRLVPYAIERLREQLRILEPQEKFDPYRQTRMEREELISRASQLPDIRHPQLLQARINDYVRDGSRKPELLVRVLAECVAVAGRLGADAAGKLLDRVLPALDAAPKTNDIPILETRLRLLERSLFFAAHFDRSDLVPGLIDRLMRFLESESASDILLTSNHAVGQTLLSLRKLGLRDETLKILDRLANAVLRNRNLESLSSGPPNAWAKSLVPLLHVATGWNCLDQTSRAAPILAAARQLLDQRHRPATQKVHAPTHVQIVCNTIMAMGMLPANEARTQIQNLFDSNLLDQLPNTLTTRSFYSRFHLNVAESVVLALASHEFALGSAARHWLDEDEYLIRQRIHRDVRAALGGANP
jgi:hypothetical protein